jgi:hypothetical protein
LNQACCSGASCNDGTLACGPGSICRDCGSLAQPCCDGTTCNDDSALYCGAKKICDSCGAIGEPCCKGNCRAGLCAANPTGGTTCQCGNLSQPCCGDKCDSPLLVCSRTSQDCISACGHLGQSCCHGTAAGVPTHAGTDAGQCFGGGTCRDDQCACGAKGEACCLTGSPCGFGLTCANRVCFQRRPGDVTCNQCASSLSLCLQGCKLDVHHTDLCKCLCQMTACDCRTQNSCALACEVDSCPAP